MAVRLPVQAVSFVRTTLKVRDSSPAANVSVPDVDATPVVPAVE
jgi:hypothetical protein